MKIATNKITLWFDGVCERCGHDAGQGRSRTILSLQTKGWPKCMMCRVDLDGEPLADVEVPDDTLVIENVDLAKLEEQRKLVNTLCDEVSEGIGINALVGIMFMLDEWSDKRHPAAKEETTTVEEQLAKAIIRLMEPADMQEIVYQDQLRTLRDCTEEEKQSLKRTYLGGK